MLHITVETGSDLSTRIDELYDAVREETKIWKMKDLRKKRNLTLTHMTRNEKKGTIRRIRSQNKDCLFFECKSKNEIDEAITVGRFVNLLLRKLEDVKEIKIAR